MGVRSDQSPLSSRAYETLLDGAETYREALVVRLCGEVGLGPAELVRLTVDDVEQVRIDPPRYLVRVPGDDDRERRTAYLPTHVEREIRRYARSNGLTADDRIFSVTPRRLQMLVSDVTDRASEIHDEPALADVSTNDLRRFFARRALVDHDVNPRAVKAAGGWRSFEALESYLREPTDSELVDAFEAVERPSPARSEENVGRPGSVVSDDSVVRLLLAASDRYALVRLDAEGYVDRWNRSAAALFGYRAGEIVGTHVSTFYTDNAVDAGVPDRVLSSAIAESGHEVDGWRVHEDGSRFRATEVVVPLRGERGRHSGFAVFVRDVSRTHDRLEELRTEREELERRTAIARCHREITQALLDSANHEELETNVCTALAAGDAYSFAWIDRSTLTDGRREWRASSGIPPASADRIVPEEWRGDGANEVSEPERRIAIVNGVSDTLEGEEFDGSLARVALSTGETTYGTLTVGTDRTGAFDGDERRWLETVGRQIGAAIGAIRRRTHMLSDRVVELELACRDAGSFFVDASRRLGCRFELDSLVPVSESTQLYYLQLEGASPGEAFDLAVENASVEEFRLIDAGEGRSRVEFVLDGRSPALTLTEYGATVTDAVFDDGVATITAECGVDADIRTIVDGLRAVYPDSSLIGKRETERAVRTAREYREGIADRLTDRQEAALRAAYFGGYYDWPRESTAEEVADAMGITSPTLHSHLRKGQHELLRTFFDDPESDDRDPS
ncbi:bacterio-opsin activator domain-containing protein [Natrialba sp. INN-245]|uniref:bacterio-opsin activator domain-containing protein n=1 Tax=Natrialba sp. INN-245 TaxID=2690967 RepID=UPI0013133AE4|nr:bacterio-opsin activator domain-containing protein [Natrialba sp. INN-245]MWV39397.1 PAS domain S-box protein [Natrialba sp. INN-245]